MKQLFKIGIRYILQKKKNDFASIKNKQKRLIQLNNKLGMKLDQVERETELNKIGAVLNKL